jgi:hypothetical protein
MCGLVLGMMAISVSGAEAGTWMIAGKNVVGELPVVAGIKIEPLGEKKEVHLVLLSTSGANKVTILCGKAAEAKATVTSAQILGTINISECKTEINEKASAGCDPINQPVEAGGIIKAVLHEGKPYAKAEGDGTTTFATFKFNEETCVALSPTIKVTGTGWLEDCLGSASFESELSEHLVQEAKVPAEKLGGLLFGGNKATIHGSVIVTLIDVPHAGFKFSGLAE